MFVVYSLEQSEQWDVIVRSFQKYDVYWLSGYVKAFKIHGDGEPLLFFYEDGRTRGINVAMKRDVADDKYFKGKIPQNQYYDFSSPYGYGGWLTEGKETGKMFSAYEEWCRKNGIISEFVRFHPIVKNHTSCERFYRLNQLGEVVHMDLKSPGIIWENLTGKNRNCIRKAMKNGVKIYHGRYPEIYEIFRTIYNSTMDKDGADEYYYFKPEFYASVLEDLPQNAQVFYARKDGKVIAASIMLMANGMINYHLSGSLQEYSAFAATNLLLYQTALWGAANGCRTMYLGGGVGSGEDSLFKFKRAFYKGECHHFYIGKKIYDDEKYQKLMNIRGSIETDYFPAYRTADIGDEVSRA